MKCRRTTSLNGRKTGAENTTGLVVPGQRIIRLNLPPILLLLFGLYVQGVRMEILPEPFILPIAWLLVPIGTGVLFVQGVIWLVWAIKRFF